MRISDWSSDVCSSDLRLPVAAPAPGARPVPEDAGGVALRWPAIVREHAARSHPRLTGVPARVQYPPPATAIVRRDRDRTRARAARRPWRAAGMGQSRAAAAVAIVRAAVAHRQIGREHD